MAFQPLSVGDILMLSQTAWKIGRAFTHGRRSAPAEFAEVERESNGLSEALKLVAETLHSDSSILSQADDDTRAAVNTILESAQKTLSDLESFVERYQVIKKKETNGGFVVERSWSEVVLANYKTFKWTTEGGDIDELRNMLQMHTTSINLTMQALQSRSLARLERTVMPMAENIANIHDRVNGDLGDKINDLHRIIMSIANSTPSLNANERGLPASSPRNSSSTTSTLEHSTMTGQNRMLEAPPPRGPSYTAANPTPLPLRQVARSPRESSLSTWSAQSAQSARDVREDSAYYGPGPSKVGAVPIDQHHRDAYRGAMDWGFENGSPEEARYSIGAHLDAGNSPSDSGYGASEPPSRKPSNVARRESSTLPNLFNAIDSAIEEFDDGDAAPDGTRDHAQSVSSSPASRSIRTWRFSGGPGSQLPPPAMSNNNENLDGSAPATPSTFFGASKRARTSNVPDLPSTRPHTGRSISKQKQSPAIPPAVAQPLPSYSDGSQFEKQLFRNAAILCDVRGRLIEYAQVNPDEPDPRYNVDMVEACKEARICVVRKRENREHVGTKVVTSIWALSEDGEVRLQQKLSDVNETVPYCSYFEPEKVSLQPTDGPSLSLKYHADRWGAPLNEEKTTNWVNYYFASENDAVAFQSAVFGRMLLGSYRTTKTTVIHEGLKGVLAFEEQFANIEMLRLWEDDGVSSQGPAGGVLALMHVSSNFGDGWARWWINNSHQNVKVKSDGARHAKVRGIDITVVRPGGTASVSKAREAAAAAAAASAASSPLNGLGGAEIPPPLQRVDTSATALGPPTDAEMPAKVQRRIAVKRVTGVRIEFKTDEERSKFVSTAKRAQERLLPLPEP